MTTDRLTTLVYKGGPLSASEGLEFDKLLAAEMKLPRPRYRSTDNGRTIDVLVAPASSAPTRPAARPELTFSETVEKVNEMSRRRDLSEAEAREFLRLCRRAERGY